MKMSSSAERHSSIIPFPLLFPDGIPRKTRSNCVLSKLSDDQQVELHDWILTLGYAKAVEKLALPVPEGRFGIKTHLMTLRRFFLWYNNKLRQEDLLEYTSDLSPDEIATFKPPLMSLSPTAPTNTPPPTSTISLSTARLAPAVYKK